MSAPDRTRARDGWGRARWVALLLVVWAGCSESSQRDPTQDQGLGQAPAPEMPVGLEVEGGEALFSLSTETPVYPFDIPGDPDHVLEGVLTDNLGRREIRYTTRADGSFEVVAAADFNLPPAGVRAASGLVAVCWNRLGGPDSPLTAGEMPDPTRGVQLLCRIRGEDGWGEVVAAGGEARAAWLSDVGVADDGTVSLDYYRDDGWFIPTRDPLHGRYRQTLRAGVLSEAVQLEGPGGF